jgi:hypothetical protein
MLFMRMVAETWDRLRLKALAEALRWDADQVPDTLNGSGSPPPHPKKVTILVNSGGPRGKEIYHLTDVFIDVGT